jgi:hypothetical protein
MDSIKRPRGLIRYDSLAGVEKTRKHWFTGRIKAYLAVWIVLMIAFITVFALRSPIEVLVLRQPGTLMQKTANGEEINFYTIQAVNKTRTDVPMDIRVQSPRGAHITMLGDLSTLPKLSEKHARFMLAIPPTAANDGDTDVKLDVYSGGVVIKTIDSKFLRTR